MLLLSELDHSLDVANEHNSGSDCISLKIMFAVAN